MEEKNDTNEELYKTIKWFYSIFHNVMFEEGWDILVIVDPIYRTFKYAVIMTQYAANIDLEKAKEFAESYGWVLDESDHLISLDTNKITTNRHLLTGTELGLL
jgi:hypothetical protein